MMSSLIKIFPKHSELPYFIKAAELLAEIIATYYSRGMIQRFQRTQFLAIGLGYKNFPDMAYRAQKAHGEAETLLFFQDSQQNERIAQAFSDHIEYIDFDTAIAIVGIAAQYELKPYLQISILVRQTRISLRSAKEFEISEIVKSKKSLSNSQRAMQSLLSGAFRSPKTA